MRPLITLVFLAFVAASCPVFERTGTRPAGAFTYAKQPQPVLTYLTDPCNQNPDNALLQLLDTVEGAPGFDLYWDRTNLYLRTNGPSIVCIGSRRAVPVQIEGRDWWVEGGWFGFLNGERDIPAHLMEPDTEYAFQALVPLGASSLYVVRTKPPQHEFR